MTSAWSPCEVGKPLYEAYEREWEMDRLPDWEARLVMAWEAWITHRDNCERCKVMK